MRHLVPRPSECDGAPRSMAITTSRSFAVHETRRVRLEGVEPNAEPDGVGREQEHELVRSFEPLQDGSGTEAARNVVEAALGEPA